MAHPLFTASVRLKATSAKSMRKICKWFLCKLMRARGNNWLDIIRNVDREEVFWSIKRPIPRLPAGFKSRVRVTCPLSKSNLGESTSDQSSAVGWRPTRDVFISKWCSLHAKIRPDAEQSSYCAHQHATSKCTFSNQDEPCWKESLCITSCPVFRHLHMRGSLLMGNFQKPSALLCHLVVEQCTKSSAGFKKTFLKTDFRRRIIWDKINKWDNIEKLHFKYVNSSMFSFSLFFSCNTPLHTNTFRKIARFGVGRIVQLFFFC